ncbi:MAG: putative metal-binding motif-containing protein [Sandaracinaceae bacterium]|nr:putative metal-binding motif-containing protein [Sandaracinaceae bacterium]
MRRCAWCLLFLVLLAGCAQGNGASLVVSLKTDFVPGVEFTEVVTRVGEAQRIYGPRSGDLFLSGVAVAEFNDLPANPSTHVEVIVRGPSGVLATRPILVDLTPGAVSVSVVITRSCRDVVCPNASNPGATACLGGRCVSERCTFETPQFCDAPEGECTDDADCPAMNACASATCELGSCFYQPVAGACGSGLACVPETGCVEVPTSADGGTVRRDAGVGMDAGVVGMDGSVGVDAASPCDGVTCGEFEYCVDGACTPYGPCRGDGTCAVGTEVCHSRRCIPGDVDVDGDGVPASMDCDETNPNLYPGNLERCNMLDEDCDDLVDEGDPATLCETNPGGGVCLDGSCGCPTGTYDLDRSIAGCECVAMPPVDQALTCAMAIDLGPLGDAGSMTTVSGNVMPDDRVVWYRFHADDAPDTACDNFHVRVRFTVNPSDSFELTVFRGDCATAGCGDTGFTDYEWATDFRADIAGVLTGQCPCTGGGAPAVTDVSACADDSADFFVRVRRRGGSVLACDPFTIEVSNGVYDTM